MKKVREPSYVVEAVFTGGQEVAEKLKKAVRKPVEFSGGGTKKYKQSIGWSYKTRRAANAAMTRLRAQKRGTYVYLIELFGNGRARTVG
jgi:hypothetical protein